MINDSRVWIDDSTGLTILQNEIASILLLEGWPRDLVISTCRNEIPGTPESENWMDLSVYKETVKKEIIKQIDKLTKNAELEIRQRKDIIARLKSIKPYKRRKKDRHRKRKTKTISHGI